MSDSKLLELETRISVLEDKLRTVAQASMHITDSILILNDLVIGMAKTLADQPVGKKQHDVNNPVH